MKTVLTALLLLFFTLGIFPAEAVFYDYTGKDINEFIKKQDKIIVLNFWATFCSPCKKEIIDLVKLQNDFKDKLIVIGASLDSSGDINLIKKVSASLKINYPVLYGVKAQYNGENITAIPRTYIIYNDRIIEKIDGARNYEYFKSKINGIDVNGKLISENKYFKFYFTKERKDKETVINFKIFADSGYGLNGEGYPPLTVSFKNNKFKVNPDEIKIKGLKKNEYKNFSVSVGGEADNTFLIDINAVACSDSQCFIIKESYFIHF